MTLVAGAENVVELYVAGVPADAGAIEARGRSLRPRTIFEGPVRLMIEFYFEKPRGFPVEYHTDKPDLGDLAGAVMDSLCGVLWLDNRQVCTLITTKSYAQVPGMNIKVQAVGGLRRKGELVCG